MKTQVSFLLLFSTISLYGSNADYSNTYFLKTRDTVLIPPGNWFNLDEEKDQVPGVSVERAYNELLKNKMSKNVVVAVLDDGIDIEHEDLKNKIWTNQDEIDGNGIDDDNNGYIDDIHGWNFIGGKDGTPVVYDNAEITRMYVQYKSKVMGQGDGPLTVKERKEFKKIEKEFEEELEYYKAAQIRVKEFINDLIRSEKILSVFFNTDEYTDVQIENLNTVNDSIRRARDIVLLCKKKNLTKEVLEAKLEIASLYVDYYYNSEYDPRSIVGDDYVNKSEKNYGNNKVVGPDASHGTHVAGIIAADRNNNLGVKGVASNVQLMVLRMSCAGDERDKDIASSIYYAVDNGAQIINMSFQKHYSPDKKFVDKAVNYAEKQGVLIVHAAGNDSENIDKIETYPTNKYLESGRKCKSWIEVASSSWKNEKNLAAEFTNYGSKSVDLFAPGVDIYSTSDNQNYQNDSGTSMSAPVVAGVAALVWSFYPELDARQIKNILMKSVVIKSHMVNQPGEQDKDVVFSSLSKSGGIINAYNAILLAEKLTK
ncbi:MAG: S8 family serine peptidase [Maribacter sp.]|nr:S8 family serine peptidase [Maribacter sp.]